MENHHRNSNKTKYSAQNASIDIRSAFSSLVTWKEKLRRNIMTQDWSRLGDSSKKKKSFVC